MRTWLTRRLDAVPPFVKKSLTSFLLRFGGLVLQFGGSILIARVLGVEGFGAYAYAYTWAVLTGSLLSLGLGQLAVREVPKYIVELRHDAIRGYMIALAGTTLMTGLVLALIFAGLEMSDTVVLAMGWKLVTILAVTHALILGMSALMSGFQRIITSQLLETILRQGLYLLVIITLFTIGVTLTPANLFIISILAAIPVLGMMLWYLLRDLAAKSTEGAPVKSVFEYSMWISGGLPLLAAAFASQLQTDVDVLMVGFLMDDASVGLYRAAARGAALAMIANFIAIQVLGPMLSRALAQNKRAEVQKLLTSSALVSAGIGLSICLVLGGGATYYLALFGPDFVPAHTVLQILLFGQGVGILCGAVAMLLVMLRRERTVLWINLAALAMNVGLNYILINAYGILGAALATSISIIFMKISLMTIILRTTEFNPTLFRPGLLRLGKRN